MHQLAAFFIYLDIITKTKTEIKTNKKLDIFKQNYSS